MVATRLLPLSLSVQCMPLYRAKECARTCDPSAVSWTLRGDDPLLCMRFCHRFFDACLASPYSGAYGAFRNSTSWCALYGAQSNCLDVPASPPPSPPPPPPPPRSPPSPPSPPPFPSPPMPYELPGFVPYLGAALAVLVLLGLRLHIRFTWERAQQAREAKAAEEAAVAEAHARGEVLGEAVAPGGPAGICGPAGKIIGTLPFDGIEGQKTDRALPSPRSGWHTARSSGGGTATRGGGMTARDGGATTRRHDDGSGGTLVYSTGGGTTARGTRLEPAFVLAARAATPGHLRLRPLPAGMVDPWASADDAPRHNGLYNGCSPPPHAHMHRRLPPGAGCVGMAGCGCTPGYGGMPSGGYGGMPSGGMYAGAATDRPACGDVAYGGVAYGVSGANGSGACGGVYSDGAFSDGAYGGSAYGSGAYGDGVYGSSAYGSGAYGGAYNGRPCDFAAPSAGKNVGGLSVPGGWAPPTTTPTIETAHGFGPLKPIAHMAEWPSPEAHAPPNWAPPSARSSTAVGLFAVKASPRAAEDEDDEPLWPDRVPTTCSGLPSAEKVQQFL
jgi:hypothetical protein